MMVMPQVLLKKGDLKDAIMVALAKDVHALLKNVFDVYQANVVARSVHYSRLRPESGALSASAVALQERLRTLVTVLFE